ncbi:hypothetical protein [Escherichia phage UPWr_E1]
MLTRERVYSIIHPSKRNTLRSIKNETSIC